MSEFGEDMDGPRLTDPSSAASDELRAALHLARDDQPSAEQIERMLANLPLGPPGGGGPGGGAAVGGAGGSSGVWALVATSAAVATLAAGVWVFTRDANPKNPATETPSARSTVVASVLASSVETAPAPAPIMTSAVAVPSAVVTSASAQPLTPPVVHSTPSALASAAPSAASAEPPAATKSEAQLLREAHAALGSSPAKALALCDEHASTYPRGSLSQEREVVRIQALLALGRRGEAQAIADAFKSRNPNSAYVRRIDELLSAGH